MWIRPISDLAQQERFDHDFVPRDAFVAPRTRTASLNRAMVSVRDSGDRVFIAVCQLRVPSARNPELVHRLGGVAWATLRDSCPIWKQRSDDRPPTISGTAVRLRLENTLGEQPVTFSAVYLG